MRIKKLNINSFGKFKNKTLEFKDGINLIYAPNEGGKSTIQGFIKCFLYGMGMNKKNIKENERKRYLPWTGEKAQGELWASHEEIDMIICRSFGSTKKEDYTSVVDEITGEEILINRNFPGKDLLSLSEESFTKTLLIKGLGAEVGRDKEEEIINKLTNLNQGGDENISYHKAIEVLENYKKVWMNQRKGGRLSELREELQRLNEEYTKTLELNNDSIEDIFKLKQLKNDKDLIIKDIKTLEIYKKHMKKIKLQKEYKEIVEYLQKSGELKKLKEEYNINIDEDFLLKLEKINEEYSEVLNRIEELETSAQEKQEILSSLRFELNKRLVFRELDEDVDRKVITLVEEKKALFQKREDIKFKEAELKNIERELQEIREELSRFNNIKDTKIKMDKLLYEYEEKLKSTKEMLSKDEKLLTYLKEKSILKKQESLWKNVSVVGIVAIFVTILLSVVIKKAILSASAIPLIGVLLFAINKKNQYKTILERVKDIEGFQGDIEAIENSINLCCNEVCVSGYKEFAMVVRRYEELYLKEERLKIRLEEKMSFLSQREVLKLKEDIERNSKLLNYILFHTSSATEEEFIKNHDIFKALVGEEKDIIKTLGVIEKEKERCTADKIEKEEKILEFLKAIGKEYVAFNNVGDEIEEIRKKVRMKTQVENQLEMVENSYRILLKDRDLEEIKKELGEIIDDNLGQEFENEDDLDDALKYKNEALLNLEKEIKDVENMINNRFIGRKAPHEIGDEIERIKEEIEEGENEVYICDVAMEVLKESFKELQKSFGPLLNNKVSKIFSFLTKGAYDEIRVSENYSISLREREGNSLFSVEYLSNGAFDQIYFALRMALMEMIFEDKEVPIILDDAFIQYDEERLKRALKLLEYYAQNKQIILFTCQIREAKIWEENKNINIINI